MAPLGMVLPSATLAVARAAARDRGLGRRGAIGRARVATAVERHELATGGAVEITRAVSAQHGFLAAGAHADAVDAAIVGGGADDAAHRATIVTDAGYVAREARRACRGPRAARAVADA